MRRLTRFPTGHTTKEKKAAIALYKAALGLTVEDLYESPQGAILHISATIGDSKFFMNDEFEGAPRKAPVGNAPVAFYLYVPDVDASYKRAVAAGMVSVAEPEEMFWGDRTAVVSDPFGYSWTFSTLAREVPEEEIEKAMAAGM